MKTYSVVLPLKKQIHKWIGEEYRIDKIVANYFCHADIGPKGCYKIIGKTIYEWVQRDYDKPYNNITIANWTYFPLSGECIVEVEHEDYGNLENCLSEINIAQEFTDYD